MHFRCQECLLLLWWWWCLCLSHLVHITRPFHDVLKGALARDVIHQKDSLVKKNRSESFCTSNSFCFFTAERPAPEQRGTVPNSVPNPWSHILALFPLPIESYCNYVPLLNLLSFSFKKTKQGNVGGARITQIPNRSNHRMVLPDTPASLLSYSFRILLCPLYEATSEFYHMISWFGFILLV